MELEILAVPRASRSRVAGEHGGRLKVQLAAPPVDGQANAALVEVLSDLCRVPRHRISVVRGETSRRKTVRVLGVEIQAVLGALTPAT